MKRLSKLLLPALLAAGCASEAYLVETAPPPPRHETVVYRPGHVWVAGHWVRRGNHWSWRDGHYVRERPGYVYVQPRWERRAQGYVYIDGGWRPRGRVYVERR